MKRRARKKKMRGSPPRQIPALGCLSQPRARPFRFANLAFLEPKRIKIRKEKPIPAPSHRHHPGRNKPQTRRRRPGRVPDPEWWKELPILLEKKRLEKKKDPNRSRKEDLCFPRPFSRQVGKPNPYHTIPNQRKRREKERREGMPSRPTGERAPQVGSLSTDTALHTFHAEDCW